MGRGLGWAVSGDAGQVVGVGRWDGDKEMEQGWVWGWCRG